MVYVVNKSGKPLMPTKRYGKVRKLLKQGLTVPISNIPFVIKLKYDTTTYTQDLWLGIKVLKHSFNTCKFQMKFETL